MKPEIISTKEELFNSLAQRIHNDIHKHINELYKLIDTAHKIHCLMGLTEKETYDICHKMSRLQVAAWRGFHIGN
jgi:hypothetical protein